MPESGTETHVLSKSEIMELMEIKGNNLELNSQGSLLENLVNSLKKTEFQRSKFSVSVQTYDFGQSDTLEKKLESIEWDFKSKIENDRLSTVESFNERVHKMKRELDAQYKKDLAAEISRFKQFEVSAIRMAEAEKCRKDKESIRDEMEKMYYSKLEALKERERSTLLTIKSKSKDLESKDFNYRRTVEKDLDFLSARESELQKQKALNEEAVKLEKEKLQRLQLDLQAQISSLAEQKSKISLEKEHDVAL